MKSLYDLEISKKAKIQKIKCNAAKLNRFNDIGICEGIDIICIGEGPLGDPRAYLIGGAVIAIRNCDCNNSLVEPYI